VSIPAQPQQTSVEWCSAEANQAKLAGAPRTAFLKKCEAPQAAATPPVPLPAQQQTSVERCSAKADQARLAGVPRMAFLKKCELEAR